jgi:DNA-binding transcriptional LysR family regulator
VADFLQQHPGTQVELIALERAVNLVEERIDLAVRIGNQLDDTLVARRIATCRSVVCAAPAYLAAHKRPRSPEQLRAHQCLTHAHVGRTQWRLQREGETVKVPVTGPLQSNEVAVTRQAALDGLGIALLPTYFISDDLAQGRLERLLPAYEPETLGIHALYLSRRHQPFLLRAMLDFLAARFGGDVAPWDRRRATA